MPPLELNDFSSSLRSVSHYGGVGGGMGGFGTSSWRKERGWGVVDPPHSWTQPPPPPTSAPLLGLSSLGCPYVPPFRLRDPSTSLGPSPVLQPCPSPPPAPHIRSIWGLPAASSICRTPPPLFLPPFCCRNAPYPLWIHRAPQNNYCRPPPLGPPNLPFGTPWSPFLSPIGSPDCRTPFIWAPTVPRKCAPHPRPSSRCALRRNCPFSATIDAGRSAI